MTLQNVGFNKLLCMAISSVVSTVLWAHYHMGALMCCIFEHKITKCITHKNSLDIILITLQHVIRDHIISICIVHIVLCPSAKSMSKLFSLSAQNQILPSHSLSLLSLSEYAPRRLRDDPFCVVMGLAALAQLAVTALESMKKQEPLWWNLQVI